MTPSALIPCARRLSSFCFSGGGAPEGLRQTAREFLGSSAGNQNHCPDPQQSSQERRKTQQGSQAVSKTARQAKGGANQRKGPRRRYRRRRRGVRGQACGAQPGQIPDRTTDLAPPQAVIK